MSCQKPENHTIESFYFWRAKSWKFQQDKSVSALIYGVHQHRTALVSDSNRYQLLSIIYNAPGQLWDLTWRERDFILTLLVVRRKGSLRRCFSEKEQLKENSINLGSGKYSQSARQPHLLSQVFWTRISTLLLSLLQKWLSHLYQSCSFVRELHAKRKKKKKNRNEGEHLSHRSTKIIQPPAPTHSSYDLLRETKRIFSMKELGMVWETRKSWLWQI